jgi:hypothetical protein
MNQHTTSENKLRTIIAHMYQIAGALNAPAHILDVLSDPDAATSQQIDAMLPFITVEADPASAAPVVPENPDELEPPELLASRLITAWCNAHGKQIPWAKAIEITAIVTKMPEDEKARLLALD